MVDMNIKRARPVMGEEEQEAISRVISSGRFILGEELKSFEKEFAGYCGTEHAIGVNSGTSALIITIKALGIGAGDEVITASNSFMSTANAIAINGARPVFVDIEPDTMNMDPGRLEDAVTERTKAIIPVHLFGHSCNMNPIVEIANKHELSVIEDAAQAHGAEYKGKRTGGLGDAACFSFFPAKNMTVYGDGGMITTNNDELLDKCTALRNQGRLKSKNDAEVFGFNNRLSEIQAAVGRVQLGKLDSFNEKRIVAAKTYDSALRDLVTIPTEKDYAKHVYHLYTIRCQNRDGLKKHLEEAGIETSINYPLPIHLQSAFSNGFGFREGMLPLTERYAKEILSLPIYPGIRAEEIEYVIEKIKEFYSA
jgi:dTDP-4-amino-4,6-dideoxygalactose transaminase